MREVIIIVLCSLCHPLAALYVFFKYRRRKSAGRVVLTAPAVCCGSRYTLSAQFTAAAGKKWYRIQSAFVLRNPASGRAQPLHPCAVTILDEDMQAVFRETRHLSDFFSFCWHSAPAAGDPAVCRCDPVLLEFRPPAPGVYTLEMSVKAREQVSRIEEFVVTLKEGVRIFKHKPYVHTWIDMRTLARRKSCAVRERQLKEAP